MKNPLDPESLFLKLPIWAQNLIVSYEGRRILKRRYGPDFFEIFENIKKRERLTCSEMKAFQQARLRAFMKNALDSPFWEKRFNEYEVSPESEDIYLEIKKMPIITKAEVKKYSQEIGVRKIPKNKKIKCHTSGTTGSGLCFDATLDFEREQWSVWWRYRQLHGINFGTECGYFGGRSIVPLTQAGPPYWRLNSPGKQLLFSAYHLNFDSAQFYLEALRKHRIQWLHGYPSIISALANFLKEQNNAGIPSLRVITTGAESLTSGQKNIIDSAFKVPVFQHYGQAEGVANISECQHGKLHVDEDFSFVEFIPLKNVDNRYRIVGTNWANAAFPLFRYDTGDIATLSEDFCECGRQGRVIKTIDGRKEDFLVLPNGALIGRLDHIFKDLVNIREAQIYQKDINSVVFRVVKGSKYNDAKEESKLLREARKRIGNDIHISVEYLNGIPRTKTGKIRLVVSEIDAAKLIQ